ncbi:hypothetical protein N7451_000219 [Penicillium sp. IBT 35674x]|nr:hypothetical protein N7451_000219 [Penicillium sp. IBT 35674x]
MDAIRKTYQLEAMIWFHGLFIILYSTPDLVDLLMDDKYNHISQFQQIVEHSLLLGESYFSAVPIPQLREF